MMNYEGMGDFEIKHAVANIALRARRDCEEVYCNAVTGECRWADGANWHNFDPLNNPSDAWPIIFSSRIMLNPYCADELWKAEVPCGFDGFVKTYATCYHRNPLRAAMIVFLMMQEKSQ